MEWNGPKQWKIWKFRMKRSRTIRKNGIREWNRPEQWKKWDTGIKRSRTMKNMEIWNGTVPNNGEYENLEWNGPEQ